jgi:aminoglycoside phosphotransferase (APT) family kinase protein
VNGTPRGSHDASADPALLRTLDAAGLPATGSFRPISGWVSRAWVGEEYVVRLTADDRHRDAYRHEARVIELLGGSDVPHARRLASGEGPDGPWYIAERLPGRTLHDAWPEASETERREMVESLGAALRALHRIPAPADLLPPWLEGALSGGPWPAFHPPVVHAALRQVDAASWLPDHDPGLLAALAEWIRERLPLFAADAAVLVHGDVHGSNVMVDGGRVSGLIDFAEAVAQPADAELDTILRWCARSSEYPPSPGSTGLPEGSLAPLPGWLRRAYPELFETARLRDRLNLYDAYVELSLSAHHPRADIREISRERLVRLLEGRNHLDYLTW